MRTARLVSVPTIKRGRTAEGPRSFLFSVAGGLCALLLSAGTGRAEDQVGGRFVSVPPTITGEAINRIRQSVEAEYKRFIGTGPQGEGGRPDAKVVRHFRVVFDFNPNNRENRNLDFGLCSKLAEVIRSLRQQGMQTIAYIHGPVAGHSVLPALTCELRVLSQNGKLGPVMVDGLSPLEDFKKAAYSEYGATTLNTPLIRKLFERDGEVRRSKVGGFAWARDPNAADTPAVVKDQELAEFNRRNYKDLGLFEEDLREDREAVARAYGLSRDTLQESVLSENVVAWQIPVSGEVNGALKERLNRRIRRALAKGANFIVLELRCHGGDTAVANDIATYLAELNENGDTPIVTVAFVTRDAQDTALYLALGCNYIVMEKDAKLGHFDRILSGRPPEELKEIGTGIEDLAKKRSYPPVLARGFVDPSVERIYYVTRRTRSHEWAIITGRDLDADRNLNPNERHWNPTGEEIPLGKDKFLTLDAAQAQRFGLAHPRAQDLASLYEDFGVK